MKSKRIYDSITIGFALFAMFLGAGNLILPPHLGLQSGDSWLLALGGFSFTAILAPFLGILAIIFSGDSFSDLGKRVNKPFVTIIGIIIMLSIGPMVAIPRTAATTYELGVLPLFNGANAIISSIVFFAITLFLSISPSKVVDIIGKYLTPIMLVVLIILVVAGIMNPMGDIVPTTETNILRKGFLEGYQTMDVLASVIFAGIIISSVKAKGYTKINEKTKITIYAGLIAMSCLLFIYGGLLYLGATSGFGTLKTPGRTELLLYISNGVLGNFGSIILAMSIALACLTTAIALTTAMGTFFSKLTNGFLNYKVTVIGTCIVSSYLAIQGVDSIIEYAISFLSLVYPIALTLVFYTVIFGRFTNRKIPFAGAVYASTVIALIGFIAHYGILTEPINNFLAYIPLNQYGLTWVVPSIVCFVLFFAIDAIFLSKKRLENTKSL